MRRDESKGDVEARVAGELARNLRTLRKARGWSQSDLADRVGFHLTHVNRVETGKYLPSLEFVVKAAEALGVSVDELLRNRDQKLQEVRLEDKELADRLRLLESLEQRERDALIIVMDSMLTKHRIREFLQDGTGTAGG